MAAQSSGQGTTATRAFAQNLRRNQPAAEVRRTVSSAFGSQVSQTSTRSRDREQTSSVSFLHLASGTVPLNEVVEPLDFEDFVLQNQPLNEDDPDSKMLEFPDDDIEVTTIPRKCRTVQPCIPKDLGVDSDPHLKDCMHCYTADWSVVNRRYQFRCKEEGKPDSRRRLTRSSSFSNRLPRHAYECDEKSKQQVEPEQEKDDGPFKGQSGGAHLLEDQPRGSWASSMFDLQSCQPDSLLPSLLNHTAAEEIDQANEDQRCLHRTHSIFSVYPIQQEEGIEKRVPATIPQEHFGQRILVKCLQLKLELDVEPIFASMALYDGRVKKKISENFYFDMNSEWCRKLIKDYVPRTDISTLSRSALFSISYPSTDVYLVVKLEKILQQGDISDVAEPFMKDAENPKHRDKVRSGAVVNCDRLGKYRMPFAWTAFHLIDIISGACTVDSSSMVSQDKEAAYTTVSLRKASNYSADNSQTSKSIRKKEGEALTRRGSMSELRKSLYAGHGEGMEWEPTPDLSNFRPVTLTVNSFFKQESDRLKDEDLYKFLADLKRPSSVLKRLKSIPGTLKLDISPPPEKPPYCLTSELHQVDPYPDEKGRPTKEVEEFAPREVFAPYVTYSNLLYVYPLNVNFTNRPGSARNIAVKVQFMEGEDTSAALECIFGKSSCQAMSREAWTSVTYHNKSPDFYEEVKMKVPAHLTDQHHILFTFYHISCAPTKKQDEKGPVEVPIGFTWIPALKDGRLNLGELHIPVSLEKPPQSYSMLSPEVQLPGMKWVEGHKGVFHVAVRAVSSVHTQDPYIHKFLKMCHQIEGRVSHSPTRSAEGNLEALLKKSVMDLSKAREEPLVRFLHIVLDKLILLLVRPPVISGTVVNIGQAAFESLSQIVNRLHLLLETSQDDHGRNNLLASYVSYVFSAPYTPSPTASPSAFHEGAVPGMARPVSLGVHASPKMSLSSSNPQLNVISSTVDEDDPFPSQHRSGTIRRKGYDRDVEGSEISNIAGNRSSMAETRVGAISVPGITTGSNRKLVHEELALQWAVASSHVREMAMVHAWFFFELMVKSMAQHLDNTDKFFWPRKNRFPEQFLGDVRALCNTTVTEIVNKQKMFNLFRIFLLRFVAGCVLPKDWRNYMSHNQLHGKSLAWSCVSNRERINMTVAATDSSLTPTYHTFIAADGAVSCQSVTASASTASCQSPSLVLDYQQEQQQDLALTQQLNSSLGFFFYDLFSLMDRGFVFELLRNYCKEMLYRGNENALFAQLRLELLRIVCSHEHFVTLNLPFPTELYPSPPSSPTLSMSSINSCTSTMSCTPTDSMAELSVCFRQQHFLSGLLLSELALALETNDTILQCQAIDTIRDLLSCHDSDMRIDDAMCRSQVAALYLPLVGIVIEALPQFYGYQSEENVAFNSHVAMAIATSSVSSKFTAITEESRPDFQSQRSSPQKLSLQTTRDLLMCFLWIVKNMDPDVLRQWWYEQPASRLGLLLDVLCLCVTMFVYGNKEAKKTTTESSRPKNVNVGDVKAKLEDMMLGGKGAAREMMQRHSRNVATMGFDRSQLAVGEPKLRWRKDQTQYRQQAEQRDRARPEAEVNARIEGVLVAEVNMVVLDTLELIVSTVSTSDTLRVILSGVLRVLLLCLNCNQSETVLQNLFATQRSIVYKFPELLFEEDTELCADLCSRLLNHCSSSVSNIRAHASASLYLLMRQNYEIGNAFSEDHLRRSLKTIITYAESDHELRGTTFPEQVRELVFNLHMILSDTVKMKEFQEDPEMLVDLMYRIAKGYQNSPDLRLTWLQNMAEKHRDLNNHAEAAMCFVHAAGLVAEYLSMLEDKRYLPIGCVALEKLSPNVLEESAVSDDVVSPDEEGICTGKYFCENGLVKLIEHAATFFGTAQLFECTNNINKLLIPILEARRDYRELEKVHLGVSKSYRKIIETEGKRMMGTYFRVGFYGCKFGDLDGEEYVYKEPTITKLPEISHRLQGFYKDKFGEENVEVIKDSNTVDRDKLDPNKAYIQLTYVEPYFDDYEMKDRITYFDKNYNIRRFLYVTPFTPTGRAHGDLSSQYKRKTILTVASSFPYVKTRVNVIHREQIVLSPIEVAIEDMQLRTKELLNAIKQDPADAKMLQMVLQGSIGTTVNQGPMEIATVFLSQFQEKSEDEEMEEPLAQNFGRHHHKLRLCFKEFVKRCGDALQKNKHLITADQRAYQKELERNYHKLNEQLEPMLHNKYGSLRGSMRKKEGTALLRKISKSFHTGHSVA